MTAANEPAGGQLGSKNDQGVSTTSTPTGGFGMLTTYIQAAMRLAKYEILEGGYYGEIPGFQGVWANADSLDGCREELQSALEDWIVLGLRLGQPLPVVAGINLVPAEI
jgi:predicted RNase H-like HicB family nuclease